jgi:RNA polymerase sigma factor (sigma-70 family)
MSMPATTTAHDVDLTHPTVLNRVRYRVRRLVRKFHLDPEEHRDLTQQFLLDLHEALGNTVPDGSGPDRMITTVLNRRYCSHLRRLSAKYRRRVTDPIGMPDIEVDYEYAVVDQAAGQAVDRQIARMDVGAGLKALPLELRRVAELLMHHKPVTAAQILGVHNSTVYRAIERIRRQFEELGLARAYGPDAENPGPTAKTHR